MKKTCAIYTRKSSEEGLEQDFNSLDAQREACEAYIKSQKSEGWVALSEPYNDGGFSGGNLERPALKKLMDDIKAGKINIVVVYKIDRLTRSLMDFAKLVEVFDQCGVTFVSVTQSFNTTTSMGRLTLNVLLSFAQFEREVTSERIRDKIAASKKKGMWMGASPPIGYRIENRQLAINPVEVPITKMIFNRYQALGCVRSLKQELDKQKIYTPPRVSKTGIGHGNRPFSRGNLYKILKNPVYIGLIKHKDKTYDGLHERLIDQEQWDAVQALLANNGVKRSRISKKRHLLSGLLYNQHGTIYTPTFTKKDKKQYRYYISQDLLQYRDHPSHVMARVPADEIEQAVMTALRQQIENCPEDEAMVYLDKHWDTIPEYDRIRWVRKITLDMETLTIDLNHAILMVLAKEHLGITLPEMDIKKIIAPYQIKRGRGGAVVIDTPSRKADLFSLPPDQLKRLVQGIVWAEDHFKGESVKAIAQRVGYSASFVTQTIFKSFRLLQALY